MSRRQSRSRDFNLPVLGSLRSKSTHVTVLMQMHKKVLRTRDAYVLITRHEIRIVTKVRKGSSKKKPLLATIVARHYMPQQ